MSIEDTISQALDPLVDQRVYRDNARFSTPRPYITFQQVGGEPVDYMAGAVPDLDNGRFQINVWADDRDTAAAIGRAARAALVGSTAMRATTASGMVATWLDGTGLYGTRQDFSIWFNPA